MPRLLLKTATALCLTCAVARSADLPAQSALLAFTSPVVPAFSWTGFHVGVNAGYASDTSDLRGATGAVEPVLGVARLGLTDHAEGVTAGGQLGYDYQFASRVVLGIEADLGYANLARGVSLPGAPGRGLTASYRTSLDALGTVRGRVGYGFGPVLAYATGGLAYGLADRQVAVAAPGGAEELRLDLRDLDLGYAVGAGVEYALPMTSPFLGPTPGAVTLRLEYLHVDMGQDSAPLSVGPQTLTAHARTSADLGRAGVNYKF